MDVPFTKNNMIKDIPVGKKLANDTFDYSHLLNNKQKRYNITVSLPREGKVVARAYYKNASVGKVSCYLRRKTAEIETAYIKDNHQGIGLGMVLYESLYKYLHTAGYKTIVGRQHSSPAARTHQKLALKHGFNYPFVDECTLGGHPFDRRFKNYTYTLK